MKAQRSIFLCLFIQINMKKVLVVDDDQDILDAIQMILQISGYESRATLRADEMDAKLQEFSPDVIILDMLLSGYDGREICKKLKAASTTKNIPIIMTSAHPSAKESVKKCGADSFIPKPFSVDGLLTEIQQYT